MLRGGEMVQTLVLQTEVALVVRLPQNGRDAAVIDVAFVNRRGMIEIALVRLPAGVALARG